MAVVLVGTDDGITAIGDAGAPRSELEGRAVTRLTADDAAVLALTDRGTVRRRAPGGEWREVATVDAATCLHPLDGGVLVGTADARVVLVADGRNTALTGFDSVDGRDAWHAVGSRSPYVRSLTVTADGAAYLANVHVGGIPRSDDGGATWTPTIDVDADVHEVRAHPTITGRAMAAAAVGLATSFDAGATWLVTTDGLHATYLRAVAFTSDAALVSASDGPFATRGALYRCDLDGRVIERCRDGLPDWLAGNIDTGCLDANGDAAAFGGHDGAVFLSTDAGASWGLAAELASPVRAVAIAPARP